MKSHRCVKWLVVAVLSLVALLLAALCPATFLYVRHRNPTRVLSDNRLAAFATDSSTYAFAAPDEEGVTVEVTLLFRRAFIALMDQKGWDMPDIVMKQETVHIP